MTQNEVAELAQKVWKSNQDTALKLATQIYALHQLPPAAPLMIHNLAALLTDLQKKSFIHGVVAMLCVADLDRSSEERAGTVQ